MSLTREQFLAGVIFRKNYGTKYHAYYKFIKAEKPGYGCIGHINELIKPDSQAVGEYDSNVYAVTKHRFQAYTAIVGISTKVWLNFADYVAVDDLEKKVD